jgi:hypothetical protein
MSAPYRPSSRKCETLAGRRSAEGRRRGPPAVRTSRTSVPAGEEARLAAWRVLSALPSTPVKSSDAPRSASRGASAGWSKGVTSPPAAAGFCHRADCRKRSNTSARSPRGPGIPHPMAHHVSRMCHLTPAGDVSVGRAVRSSSGDRSTAHRTGRRGRGCSCAGSRGSSTNGIALGLEQV